MTTDDENTVYVGGLPYDCSDSQLHRAFELYGSIISVKIINDRGTWGKCYGFVTFKNPRSAIEAIDEMNGRTIGGRVVRVNEATTRVVGGRSDFDRESIRRNKRDIEWEARVREMEHAYNDSQRDGSRMHDGERERSRGYSRDHSRDHSRDRDQFRNRDISRDHFRGRNREQSRELGEWQPEQGREQKRNREQEWEDIDFNFVQERELASVDHDDRRVDKNEDQHRKRNNSSSSCEQQSRDFSSESSDYQYQVEEKLDSLIKRRDELQKEKFEMEKRLEEKKRLTADLEKRSLKLEDSLTSAKKHSSEHQTQLIKLYKCFQQVKEYGDKLRSSEEELQDLVNTVSKEVVAGDDLGAKDVYLTNGKL